MNKTEGCGVIDTLQSGFELHRQGGSFGNQLPSPHAFDKSKYMVRQSLQNIFRHGSSERVIESE